MEQIQATFATCKNERRAALVAYFTSGYPTVDDTTDIMLGLQAGGAGKTSVVTTLIRANWDDTR
jgi:tryptophan synthase